MRILVLVILFWISLSAQNSSGEKKAVETNTKLGTIMKNMVFVKGGTFKMGNENGESDEKPVFEVSVHDFYISKYEVSREEWWKAVNRNDRNFTGDNLPVVMTAWFEAIEFCNKASMAEGLEPCYIIDGRRTITKIPGANGYRLPSEIEWEYAARGGQLSKGYKYSGSNNPDDVAWYKSNSALQLHPMGEKTPNELGLYDMSGNVWEWCYEWYEGDAYKKYQKGEEPDGVFKVVRGGAFDRTKRYIRSSVRFYFNPDYRRNFIGFRVVRDAE